MHRHDVIIVGGGPAGSSAAIHLARRGVDVLVLEKEVFPRDKLCGEFHSTEVAELCRRLDVLERLLSAGARPISTVRLSGPDGRGFKASLPGLAYGISRRTFDEQLIRRASECGADVREGISVRSVEGDLGAGFVVGTDAEELRARVVVGAYGRRSPLDRRFERSFLTRRSPYVAFKAHYRGEMPNRLIELHVFRHGYCGLLQEESGDINVCWIAHSDELRRAGGSPEAMAVSALSMNPALVERLRHLKRTGEFLAVGELAFRPKGLFASDVCMIGDAAGMIAPLCGDGMAMALATGELVAPFVFDLLAGKTDVATFRRRYSHAWNRQFRRRMFVGRTIQRVLLEPRLADAGIRLCQSMPALTRAIVRATRG